MFLALRRNIQAQQEDRGDWQVLGWWRRGGVCLDRMKAQGSISGSNKQTPDGMRKEHWVPGGHHPGGWKLPVIFGEWQKGA